MCGDAGLPVVARGDLRRDLGVSSVHAGGRASQRARLRLVQVNGCPRLNHGDLPSVSSPRRVLRDRRVRSRQQVGQQEVLHVRLRGVLPCLSGARQEADGVGRYLVGNVASARKRSASRARSTTSGLGPVSPVYARVWPPATSRIPALRTKWGRSHVAMSNGPIENRSPGANSWSLYASSSKPGRSSARTLVTASGTAWTGRGGAGSSRRVRARSRGCRSAQWSGWLWLTRTASTFSAVATSSRRGRVAYPGSTRSWKPSCSTR